MTLFDDPAMRLHQMCRLVNNIKVGLLLHFYQPWSQLPEVLAKIVEESYLPIFRLVDARPGFAFSANIQGSLLELLAKHGHHELLNLIRRVVEQGKVELFGTAAHHPILPLINDAETERQILRDQAIKRLRDLPASTCGGCYLAEFASSETVAKCLQRLGYAFTVADDKQFALVHGFSPMDIIPRVHGLSVFLRSSKWGHAIGNNRTPNGKPCDFDNFGQEFVNGMSSWFAGRTGYVILATDAETFGHHHKMHIEWLLRPMLECWSRPGSPVDIMPFQQLHQLFSVASRDIMVPAGSWSTEDYDHWAGNPFPLWNSPDNCYHQAMWRIINLVRPYGDTPGLEEKVMRMLASCWLWWASRVKNEPSSFLVKANVDLALEIAETLGGEPQQAIQQACEDFMSLPGVKP